MLDYFFIGKVDWNSFFSNPFRRPRALYVVGVGTGCGWLSQGPKIPEPKAFEIKSSDFFVLQLPPDTSPSLRDNARLWSQPNWQGHSGGKRWETLVNNSYPPTACFI